MVPVGFKKTRPRILPREILGEERDGEWFRGMKEGAKGFHDDVKVIKGMEEMASAVATTHNMLAQGKIQGGVILT